LKPFASERIRRLTVANRLASPSSQTPRQKTDPDVFSHMLYFSHSVARVVLVSPFVRLA